MDEQLKVGDRITFKKLGRVALKHGTIVGEIEHGWTVVMDGTSGPRGVHKSFCQREAVDVTQ